MSTFVIGDVHGRREQLRRLVGMLPRDPARDTLVLLGDLIDRGDDVPGVVRDALALVRDPAAGHVVVLRGNHEQMLLDFMDTGAPLWLHPACGGDDTFEQYAGFALTEHLRADCAKARRKITEAVPAEHVEFFRSLPLYHEDDYAIYVHAGLDCKKHPCETEARLLLWTRDSYFYKHYHGKPCVFGHTPTPLLPLLGRLGRHGIYVAHSAIGIDTGYSDASPLTCLRLPEFTLYQTYADGRADTHQFTSFIPEHLRAFPRNGQH
ncbi:MAG TPA: metallophosphoesterase [Pyrinomonadaceae bacterium]